MGKETEPRPSGGPDQPRRRDRPGARRARSGVRLFVRSVVLCFAVSLSARAAEITVVQSAAIRAYDQAVQAFERTLPPTSQIGGPRSVRRNTYTEILLSDSARSEAKVLRQVRSRKPDLVLAVGSSALAALVRVRDVPVVYLMAPGARALVGDRRNATGVDLEIPPRVVLNNLLLVRPDVRRVGTIYDERGSTDLIQEAFAAAKDRNIAMVARKATSPHQVGSLLATLKGGIDAYWMLPDPMLTSREVVETLALFSLENRVPIVTFSRKYLALGAALAVTFDVKAMGEQAARLAHLILSGVPVERVPPASPDRFSVDVNHAVWKRLGLASRADPPETED